MTPPPVTTAKGRSTKQPSISGASDVQEESLAHHARLLVSTVQQVDTCVVAYMTDRLNHHTCCCGMGQFSKSLNTLCRICQSSLLEQTASVLQHGSLYLADNVPRDEL